MEQTLRRRLIVFGILAASLYGTTYQQFRHFNAADPRGAEDSESYIRMAHGDYQVGPIHRYRFLGPVLASVVHISVQRVVRDPAEQDKLSFYIVNFAFSLASAQLLMMTLEELGIGIWACLMGTMIFVVSRMQILATGTPLVDAPYLTAVAFLIYCTVARRFWLLTLSLPILALVKEPMLAVILLPLIVPYFRRVWYAASVVVSVVAVYASRYLINHLVHLSAAQSPSLYEVAMKHAREILISIGYLFSPTGMHDLQNGFSLFLVFAALGFCMDFRQRRLRDGLLLQALVVLAFALAMLSRGLGRLFFTAFPAVAAYAAIFFERALGSPAPLRTAVEEIPEVVEYSA